MATILGVNIPANTVSGNWLATECSNTAADYWYQTRLLPLVDNCNMIRAAALDSDTMDALDQAESGLFTLRGILNSLVAQAKIYKDWLIDLQNATGSFGWATEASCDQNMNTLQIQKMAAVNIYNVLVVQRGLTINTIAEIQAIQDDEINEEQIQNQLNDAANRINAERLEVEARLQEVRAVEFVNNLQQVLLPLLLVSVAVVIFTRKR